MPELTQILNNAGNNHEKKVFFQELNEAILIQENISHLLDQGNNFYMELNEILIRTQQSINDYKFSRDLQKNDLISKIMSREAENDFI